MSRKKKDRTFGKRKAEEQAEETEQAGGWTETLKSFGLAIVLFLIIRTFLLQTFFITSGSMRDTMLVGDFLVVNRAAIGSTIPFTSLKMPGYSEPRRGDVLVFDPHHSDTLMLVKRLVGMPGDTLEMRERTLFINGEEQVEDYLRIAGLPDDVNDVRMQWQLRHLTADVDRASYIPSRDSWGPIVIPEGQYFMLGDNRDESLDSRYWGLLDGERFEGRVSFIYYSYDRDSLKPMPAFTTIRWGRIFDRIR